VKSNSITDQFCIGRNQFTDFLRKKSISRIGKRKKTSSLMVFRATISMDFNSKDSGKIKGFEA